ncbi:MAG: hypothetical protein IAE80_07325, partial [Anaerolinea sp.]|nr:hypothetical protein [Anaerolinea sp.]
AISQPDRPESCIALRGFFQAVPSRQFWLNSTVPDAAFQVLRGDELLAQCPVNAGECRVDLGE